MFCKLSLLQRYPSVLFKSQGVQLYILLMHRISHFIDSACYSNCESRRHQVWRNPSAR